MSELQAILFDFDDTLSDEAGSFAHAVRNVVEAELTDYEIPVEAVIESVSRFASEEWSASKYSRSGISRGVGASEVFAGGFVAGETGRLLEAESERIRPLVWRGTLAEIGITDEALVSKLSLASLAQGTGPHLPYSCARETLSALSGRFSIGLVTNGNPDTQRRKVTRSGLEEFFKAIVVSGDVGLETVKPDPRTFERALSSLGVEATKTVMIGDNCVNDIHGAASLGMKTIWVNMSASEFDGPTPPDHQISELCELPKLIDRIC